MTTQLPPRFTPTERAIAALGAPLLVLALLAMKYGQARGWL